MIDVVVGGARSLFADLLLSVLRSRGLEVALVAPSADVIASSVAMSRPETCIVEHRPGTGPIPVPLIEAAVTAGGGDTRVAVLSALADDASLAAARAAGAIGYIHTTTGMDTLLEALDDVRAGRQSVRLPRPTGFTVPSEDARAHRLASTLTRREWDCLRLLVGGFGTTDMARTLVISELTVRSHIQSVLTKLGVHSRLEAATMVVRLGLLGPGNMPEARAV